jgi:hypothetical protein
MAAGSFLAQLLVIIQKINSAASILFKTGNGVKWEESDGFYTCGHGFLMPFLIFKI